MGRRLPHRAAGRRSFVHSLIYEQTASLHPSCTLTCALARVSQVQISGMTYSRRAADPERLLHACRFLPLVHEKKERISSRLRANVRISSPWLHDKCHDRSSFWNSLHVRALAHVDKVRRDCATNLPANSNHADDSLSAGSTFINPRDSIYNYEIKDFSHIARSHRMIRLARKIDRDWRCISRYASLRGDKLGGEPVCYQIGCWWVSKSMKLLLIEFSF